MTSRGKDDAIVAAIFFFRFRSWKEYKSFSQLLEEVWIKEFWRSTWQLLYWLFRIRNGPSADRLTFYKEPDMLIDDERTYIACLGVVVERIVQQKIIKSLFFSLSIPSNCAIKDKRMSWTCCNLSKDSTTLAFKATGCLFNRERKAI